MFLQVVQRGEVFVAVAGGKSCNFLVLDSVSRDRGTLLME